MLCFQATTNDAVFQAKNLVKRMRNDTKVDMNKHWKLITLSMGGNEFCQEMCYYEDHEKSIEKSAQSLLHALRILRENLPRSMVNVVLPPNVAAITKMSNISMECQMLHYLECPCYFSLSHQEKLQETMNSVSRLEVKFFIILFKQFNF